MFRELKDAINSLFSRLRFLIFIVSDVQRYSNDSESGNLQSFLNYVAFRCIFCCIFLFRSSFPSNSFF